MIVYNACYTDFTSKHPAFPDTRNCNITADLNIQYADVLNEWLEYQRLNVKESSYARYHQIVYSHLIPALGNYKIYDINQVAINQLILNLLKNGRLDNHGGLSPKSVDDIVSVVKSSICFASAKGYPTAGNMKLLPIRHPSATIRVLSLSEQGLLCQCLLHDTDFIKLGILLSLYTGLRIGEVCALKWANLNTDEGIIYVRATMQRVKNIDISTEPKTKIIITTPKSEKSVRDIPIPPFLAEIAKKLKSGNNTYVLTGNDKKFVEPRTMQNHFKKYASVCGIDNANYHCLRHTFATRCIELGFDTKTLSEILGHSNVNITLNRYVHSSFDLKKQEMKKLTIYN